MEYTGTHIEDTLELVEHAETTAKQLLRRPNVKTSCVYPPIPLRQYDWCAFADNTYDGAPDAGHQILGHGATEAEAISDFWEQWSEEHTSTCALTVVVGDGQDNQPCGGFAPIFCRKCRIEICHTHIDHFLGEIYCDNCGSDERERNSEWTTKNGYPDIGQALKLELKSKIRSKENSAQ